MERISAHRALLFGNRMARSYGPALFWSLISLCFCALFALSPVRAESAESSPHPPNALKPTVVDVYLYMEDISNINLILGTYDATAQLLFKWHDHRLAFDPAENEGRDRRIFVGPAAQAQLKKIWQPWIEVSGERGLRTFTIQSLIVSADGSVEVHQKFHTSPKFSGELVGYPFGSLRLPITITSLVHDTNSVKFNPQTVDPVDLDELDEVLHGNWEPAHVNWSVHDVRRDDIPDTKFQQLEVEIVVAHDFMDGLHKIFLPLFVVGLASIGLLWINPVAQPAYSSPRIGGYTTLILTIIALKLALRADLPVVHYGTFTDALYNLTIVMLLGGLLSSCAVVALNTAGKQAQALQLMKRLQIIYPTCYSLLIGLTCLIFFSLLA